MIEKYVGGKKMRNTKDKIRGSQQKRTKNNVNWRYE